MLVNPAPGALVRDPATKHAISPGACVDENDPYFARALLDGDLVAADATPPAMPTAGRRSGAVQDEESK